MYRRMDGTEKEMLASGQWVRIGKSHYRHMSGAEIKKRNEGGWIVSTEPNLIWSRLWVARHEVERVSGTSENK